MSPEAISPALPAGASLIDVHTHVVPDSFPAYLGRHADVPWPSMAPAHACHRHVVVSGKVYRTMSHQCWDCAVRFACEVGLAAASMITGGTLDRVPGLRIAFSHGGGSPSLLLPRLRHAWRTVPPVRGALAGDPVDAARRMYDDDLVYDATTIHRLIEVFGTGQILAGTDYPFTIMNDDPVGRLESLGLDAAALQQLRSGNARRWLGLAPRSDRAAGVRA